MALSIVRNTRFTRLHGRRESVEFDEEIHTVEETAPGPDVDLERRAAAQSVREGLGATGRRVPRVLVLRELEDLSYKKSPRFPAYRSAR